MVSCPLLTSDFNAELSLRTYGDERAPSGIRLENVMRWYILNAIGQSIDKKKEKINKEVLNQILFIIFDKPVRVTNLEVMSPDMELPSYEVKEFDSWSAIIMFSPKLPAGTLNIIVHP